MIRDVELTILGSGTSAGVPLIGCDCAVCTSIDPRNRRLRTSAALRFVDAVGQARVILLDTSPDLREQALRAKLVRCDAVLYTHNHVDHTFGLDEVRRFNALMRAPIPVHADRSTMEHLQRVYRHIFERDRNPNDSFVATLIPVLIEAGTTIDLHGIRVLPIELLHGNLPILGFRIEAIDANGGIAAEQPGPLPLAYCTDVSAIPAGTWSALTGLQTLVLDMLRYRKHPTHLTVDDAVNIAAEVGAEQTLFVHMTHDIDHADLDARLPGGMRLAWDGMNVQKTNEGKVSHPAPHS